MSEGVGITYLWLKDFPPFIRLEGRRGDYETYVPERTCECDGSISWEWTGPTTYYEHELSCGHVITSVDSEPPKFCEECGAKVIV